MKPGSVLFVAALCVAACRTLAPTPPDHPVVELAFAEVKLYSNEELGFVMRANGTIERADGSRLGRITKDGRIVSLRGTTLATLNDDGFVLDRLGKRTNAKVLPDGSLEIDGKTHRFLHDGTLSGGKPGAPTIRAEGVTDKVRRAAMFLLVAILMPTS